MLSDMSYFTPYKEHYKALIRLGIPIVIGQIGIVVVGLADNMMVGQYATLDLAAASFVNSAFNIPILFGLGFSYGLTPLVGQISCRSTATQQSVGKSLHRLAPDPGDDSGMVQYRPARTA